MTSIQPTTGKPSKSDLVRWQKLYMSKYRRREGLFLAEGRKVIGDLQKSRWQIEALLGMAGKEDIYSRFLGNPSVYPGNGKATPGGGTAEGKAIPRYILSEKEWGKLTQDQAPEGVMAVVRMPPPGNWQARLQ